MTTTPTPFAEPYKNIDDLVQLLRTRGLKITNQQKAERYLSTIGYFRCRKHNRKIQINMIKLDTEKLAKLKTVDQLFDEKYGAKGSATREAFEAESAAWYFGELMRERRKELNLTQEDLAARVNAKRTYISRVERGATDIQMSSFFRLTSALGIRIFPEFA